MTVTPVRLGWLLVTAALLALIAYSLNRTQFTGLLGLYFLAVWGYSIRIRSLGEITAQPPPDTFLLASAILFRVLLLAAPSNLSDDYARFIWDGRLLVHGFNPYLYLPRSITGTDIANLANLTQTSDGLALFSRLNSPDYYTVYPPLNQVFFGLAAWLGGHSLPATVIWLRVPIVLAEIGTIYLLPQLLSRLRLNPNYAIIYALNPLVILELTGNVHFEAVVIFFCVWATLELTSYRENSGNRAPGISALWRSAVLFGLAVSTKLLPLIGLPLLIRYLGWRRGSVYAGVVGLTIIGSFLPFASLELIRNISSSIGLYFQKFEFNASVYYLVRAVGYWVKGYNVIQQVGPWLSLITFLGILLIAFYKGQMSVGVRLLLTLTFYFVMATTVHPWYISLVVAASVFTPFRYPLVWSALVWASYATYQREPYHENLWLTTAEYVAVLVIGLWEWWQYRQRPSVEIEQADKTMIG